MRRSSGCIANCADDERVPPRSTYVNLHSHLVSADASGGGDGISFKKLLYRTKRRRALVEPTNKSSEVVAARGGTSRRKRKAKVSKIRDRRKIRFAAVVIAMRRAKELSRAALCAIFHKLLFCTASIDVVDHTAAISLARDQ